MTGAETGVRAGYGTGTGEGREAETGAWAEIAETWAAVLTETGAIAGTGAGTYIWAEVDVKVGAGL